MNDPEIQDAEQRLQKDGSERRELEALEDLARKEEEFSEIDEDRLSELIGILGEKGIFHEDLQKELQKAGNIIDTIRSKLDTAENKEEFFEKLYSEFEKLQKVKSKVHEIIMHEGETADELLKTLEQHVKVAHMLHTFLEQHLDKHEKKEVVDLQNKIAEAITKGEAQEKHVFEEISEAVGVRVEKAERAFEKSLRKLPRYSILLRGTPEERKNATLEIIDAEKAYFDELHATQEDAVEAIKYALIKTRNAKHLLRGTEHEFGFLCHYLRKLLEELWG